MVRAKMAVAGKGKILGSLIFIIFFVKVSCDVTKRTVKVTPWPDCDSYKKECEEARQNNSNVVYAKAFAQGDSLLYASSSIGTPVIVLARVTGGDGDMHFNWTKLVNESSLEDAITISGGVVEYKFGVAFTRLIEYNDLDDNADLNYEDTKPNNTANWKILDFNTFTWVLETSKTAPNTFVFNATSEQQPIDQGNSSSAGNWSISFSFTVHGDSGRSSELPSLKYGVNVTQLDFVIANYTPTFSSSRFAIEAVLVSQFKKDMNIETTNSIDDEYSPGVFQIVNWLSNPSQEQDNGYLQWKPVCYNSKSRSRSSATEVKHYDLSDLRNRENMTGLLNMSIISALFDKDLYNGSVTIRTTNISFGLSQDGFYIKKNYTAWSATVGYGTPPEDSISLTVIAIISAGLGLPVIILILGGIYTCVKKAKQSSQYEAINSETTK